LSFEFVTLIIFGIFLLFLFLGIPLAWAMGGLSVLAALILWGPVSLYLTALSVMKQWTDSILMALPLFVLLANLLQRSEIGDELYEAGYRWLGAMPGGLALGTIIICTIFAAISGLALAAVISMGIIALPSMLRRKYNKSMVLGTIVVGGSLGPLIPPSIIMIFYAYIANLSVGQLWFGGFVPGIVWMILFLLYIGIRCKINPSLGPPMPREERVSWQAKFISLRAIIAPILVVIMILGTIYLGIATPTEASVIGCLGMFIAVGIRRKLKWVVVKDALYSTLTLTAMAFWLLLAISCFNSVYLGLGARQMVEGFVLGLDVSPFIIVLFMMGILFLLGMFMDTFAIILITAPIFTAITNSLGIDPLWFGILYIMNCSMSNCTPPYGFSLFMLRTVTPREITMGDIYRSVWPFVAIQVVGMVLVMIFPKIVTWLPSLGLL